MCAFREKSPLTTEFLQQYSGPLNIMHVRVRSDRYRARNTSNESSSRSCHNLLFGPIDARFFRAFTHLSNPFLSQSIILTLARLQSSSICLEEPSHMWMRCAISWNAMNNNRITMHLSSFTINTWAQCNNNEDKN